jgi:hypothetical protein
MVYNIQKVQKPSNTKHVVLHLSLTEWHHSYFVLTVSFTFSIAEYADTVYSYRFCDGNLYAFAKY